MRAVLATGPGGPEMLRVAEIAAPQAACDEVEIEVRAAGVNFADLHQLDDTYLVGTTFPFVPGSEVVGVTPDGRRVLALVDNGGYAERAVADAGLIWQLPDEVPDAAATTALIQGATAWHLLRTCGRLAAGESVVVHAAAGGVGTIAVQLAANWGAGNIIASASTEEKRALALSLGADVAIDSTRPDLDVAIREANGGRRVDLILEMTGGSTFDQSLAALAPFGRLVTYGQAGRVAATPVVPWDLVAESQSVIGFWLARCVRRPQMLGEAVAAMLEELRLGRVKPVIGGSFRLEDAHLAHRALGTRASSGKLILTP
ncbi:MAG: zinc-binding dehydrogenase [Actinobacteria bacterium]|nr:zinc-binding dehydrogenase [Actinomycetota bacterium]